MADLIISDESWESFRNGAGNQPNLCGMLARDYQRVPFGSMAFAQPLGDAIEPIPMEEWPDRIADLERSKSTLKHIWQQSDGKVWDQAQLSYCHSFASVKGYDVTRDVMGLPKLSLSASSVAAPITNYRNQGWFIEDALKQMVEVGVATTDFVPMLTTSRNAFKAGWQANAAQNKVTGWFDVPARNLLIHGSMLLLGYPVVVGLNYWGHAVLDLVLRDMNSRLPATNPARYGSEFLNSWRATWGNGGFGVRTGSKFLADSIYALSQGSIG